MLSRLAYSSRGMMFSVLCHDEIPFSSLVDFQTQLSQYPQLAGMYHQSILGELTYQVCPEWGASEADVSASQPVRSSIHTLVLSGEYDPITPPAWAEAAAMNLENAYLFEFPGFGHGVSGNPGCPQTILEQFWRNPSTAPDAFCLKELQ